MACLFRRRQEVQSAARRRRHHYHRRHRHRSWWARQDSEQLSAASIVRCCWLVQVHAAKRVGRYTTVLARSAQPSMDTYLNLRERPGRKIVHAAHLLLLSGGQVPHCPVPRCLARGSREVCSLTSFPPCVTAATSRSSTDSAHTGCDVELTHVGVFSGGNDTNCFVAYTMPIGGQVSSQRTERAEVLVAATRSFTAQQLQQQR